MLSIRVAPEHRVARHAADAPTFKTGEGPEWGIGSAPLNDEPLYEGYEIHFMVTQGMRGRDLVARYPTDDKKSEAGGVNPALQQLDFYIRSPEKNDVNHPDREVFDHLFAMEVAWK